MRNLKQDSHELEEAMASASGVATLALDGNREALKTWAALIARYLHDHLGQDLRPAEHGFPQPYEDADARMSLLLMAEALERIHNGEEPNRALGWNSGKKGRPSKAKATPRRAIIDTWRVETIEAYIAGGATVRAACELVAEEHSDSAQRLEQLYRRSR